jgi:hypothetical protein
MRALAISAMILISLGFTGLSAPSTGLAQEACRCKGCGCKGGSGWRGPDGACVSTAKLAEICGTPAGTPCKQEAAPRVCFGKQAAASSGQAAP